MGVGQGLSFIWPKICSDSWSVVSGPIFGLTGLRLKIDLASDPEPPVDWESGLFGQERMVLRKGVGLRPLLRCGASDSAGFRPFREELFPRRRPRLAGHPHGQRVELSMRMSS